MLILTYLAFVRFAISELVLEEAYIIRRAIGLPDRIAIELQENIAVRTETLRRLRNPEVRSIQEPGLGCMRLWRQNQPLI